MNDVYDSLPELRRHLADRAPAAARHPGPAARCWATASTSRPPRWTSSRRPAPMCVNNPESNMGNAVGCAPVLQIYRQRHPGAAWAPTPTPTTCWRASRCFLTIQRHNACHAQRGLGARPWTCSSRTTPPWRASTSARDSGRSQARRRGRRHRDGLPGPSPPSPTRTSTATCSSA